MSWLLYTVCTLTALLCSFLLFRAYWRSRYKLLLWSGLCFAGLALNNALIVVDIVILGPAIDLYPIRLFTAFLSMMALLYGLIWEVE